MYTRKQIEKIEEAHRLLEELAENAIGHEHRAKAEEARVLLARVLNAVYESPNYLKCS